MDGQIDWPLIQKKTGKEYVYSFQKIPEYMKIWPYLQICVYTCVYILKVSSVYINVLYITLENNIFNETDFFTPLEKVWNGALFCGRQSGNFNFEKSAYSLSLSLLL